jgi:hypothetical protein
LLRNQEGPEANGGFYTACAFPVWHVTFST